MSWTNADKELLEGGCSSGVAWALTLNGPLAVLTSQEHPDWSLWLLGRADKAGRTDLTSHPEAVAAMDPCAEREPWHALKYAAAVLTPERLAACKREVQ